MASNEAVNLVLSGNATSLERALKTVVAGQKEMVKEFTRSTDAMMKQNAASNKNTKNAKKSKSATDSLTSSLKGMAAGYLGVTGLSRGFRFVTGNIEAATKASMSFEKSITPLLSLGDNLSGIQSMRSQVMGVSAAFGVTNAEASKAMFNIQSAASNLSKEIKDDLLERSLELARITGTELPTAVYGMTKAYQIFGDEVESVAQLQAKMFKTAELGAITFEDLARLMPEVGSSAKAFGFSLDEVSAALTTATRIGGRTEKVFTGVRNVFLRMGNAMKEGVYLTGSLEDQLTQLASVDTSTIKKIFGDEALAVVINLINNVNQFKNDLKIIEQTSAQLVEIKTFKKMADDIYLATERMKTLNQIMNNEEAKTGVSPFAMKSKQISNAIYEGLPVYMKSRTLADAWGWAYATQDELLPEWSKKLAMNHGGKHSTVRKGQLYQQIGEDDEYAQSSNAAAIRLGIKRGDLDAATYEGLMNKREAAAEELLKTQKKALRAKTGVSPAGTN